MGPVTFILNNVDPLVSITENLSTMLVYTDTYNNVNRRRLCGLSHHHSNEMRKNNFCIHVQ